MEYITLTDQQKQQVITNMYIHENKSFQDIATAYNTYTNKVRRDAKKFEIPIRDKSSAQKNALQTGKHKHPTKGLTRTQETKNKIGTSVMHFWDNMDAATIQQRKDIAKKNWDNLSLDQKQFIKQEANNAVRQASKEGSKLEKFLLVKLIEDGYKVDFHKEQTLSNTKLQIDLFIPHYNIAIEVDGPSHFLPVWGEKTLNKNIAYDNKKTGLILGKGLVLIRIKQLREFSNSRASALYTLLEIEIKKIINKFPETDQRNIQIGD